MCPTGRSCSISAARSRWSSKSPLKTRDDLSMAYTPGVARVCTAIAEDVSKVWNLTIKQNTVAVVSDGTAVLGLGDIGPEAAMPVMEGKAMLFKEFGGVDAWPICLATTDVDEIVAAVAAIAPGFGGINLEDISAPRCFEIESRLEGAARHPRVPRRPARHGDRRDGGVRERAEARRQAAEDVRIVMTGVGAAGVACTDMLLGLGVRNIIGCDRKGALHLGRDDLGPGRRRTPSARTRRASPAPPTRRSPAPTCSSASPARARSAVMPSRR